MISRLHIHVEGIVQGVGFRPFVHLLAERLNLAGWVLNSAAGVEIEVEGERVPDFLEELRQRPPPLATLEKIVEEPLPAIGTQGFQILASNEEEEPITLIPPDVATCPDCLREMNDPADRRYHYPFLNCTHCGPRFTIIERLPYDRPRTSMKAFSLCPDCAREYADIHDRRYHAQPVACPRCGPRLELIEGTRHWDGEEALERSRQLLASSRILAVKGLGGFHLVTDATCEEAVDRLRRRKGRSAKSLAVMVPSLAEAREIALIPPLAEELLVSWQRPIVLLPRREGILAPSIAPDNGRVGVMLPYTPLHHLLLEGFTALVMTSANESEEPIVAGNEEALTKLEGIADAFLLHDRPIVQRLDDSVQAIAGVRPMMVRRARGYAPGPFRLARTFPPTLACGPELKNTFALSKRDALFLSHHIGDLQNLETYQHYQRSIAHLEELYALEPEVVAHDLHPQYLSTRYALSLPAQRKVAVQHHHAHIAAVLFEAGEDGPVIGVACDGTGYGEDGAIWGMEFFLSFRGSSQRLGHLAYVPLLGNEEAVRRPWRMAASHLFAAMGEGALPFLVRIFPQQPLSTWEVLWRQWQAGFHSPPTSSAGRLFDVASAMLGFTGAISYEGQAAIRLEHLAEKGRHSPAISLCLPLRETDSPRQLDSPRQRVLFTLDPSPLLVSLAEQVIAGGTIDRSALAYGFHLALAHAIVASAQRIRLEYSLSLVALAGGVFANNLLLQMTQELLEAEGFRILVPQRLPPNDGAIAVGQAVTAFARLEEEGCV